MTQTRAVQWRNVARRLGVATAPLAGTPGIQTRKALREAIAEDLRAQGIDRYRWHHRLTDRVVHFQVLLRKAEYWDSSGNVLALIFAPVSRLRVIRLGELLGFTVPLHVTAPGFSIAHPGTVTISALAVVGRGCRIHTDVCIGELKGAAPVIGDDVWIGPGAKIFGPITVGDGVAIGANAVVNSDVPAGVTVAGIPARIVSDSGSAELFFS